MCCFELSTYPGLIFTKITTKIITKNEANEYIYVGALLSIYCLHGKQKAANKR